MQISPIYLILLPVGWMLAGCVSDFESRTDPDLPAADESISIAASIDSSDGPVPSADSVPGPIGAVQGVSSLDGQVVSISPLLRIGAADGSPEEMLFGVVGAV